MMGELGKNIKDISDDVILKICRDEIDKYKIPKEYLPGVVSSAVNWVELINSKFSLHGDKPVFDSDEFQWVKELENNWKTIRAELDQVMTKRKDLPNFHDIMEQVDTITNDNNWKTFFLAGYGLESEENAKRCPETMKVLNKIPGMKTAFFSILSPKKHITEHKGPYNGVLRYHLGLLVPEPKENCMIRIHDKFYFWDEGESLVFDDTYNHEVWNDTEGFRAVLFVDFKRPVKFPFNLFNELFLKIAAVLPVMKEAEKKHKKWEEKFYKDNGTKNFE